MPGIGIVPVHPDLVAQAGIDGVVSARVLPGTPAAKAGLRPLDPRTGDPGDVIVAVNGKPVASLPQFGAALDHIGAGHEAELTVIRDGERRRLRVRVADFQR